MQRCPLPGNIFALAVGPMCRSLAVRPPAHVFICVAFADDWGLGGADIFATPVIALPVLNVDSGSTGLRVNLCKPAVVRVSGAPLEYVQASPGCRGHAC